MISDKSVGEQVYITASFLRQRDLVQVPWVCSQLKNVFSQAPQEMSLG